MSSDQIQSFKGIISCIPSFDNANCLTKTIEFSISCVLFVTALVILYQYLRFFGFKDKIYINLSLLFMIGFLLMNMVYCFWNNLYPFYSIQTYFHNLYFLCIVVYTTKSFLLKQGPKPQLSISRVSNNSNDSSDEQDVGVLTFIRTKILTNIIFYKFLYKAMTIIFLFLFTLIFITSLIGDIESKKAGQTLAEDQGQQPDYTLFSFLKNSCQELWYLCVNGICVVLSLIVLLVLYKNYILQKQRIKSLTLVTSTVHEKPAPFTTRDQQSRRQKKMRKNSTLKNLHNPLGKLALWMGLNILGQIIDLVYSGLLLNANPQNECQIIENPTNNSILKLFLVIGSVYVQYSISFWFFFITLKQKLKLSNKREQLLISPYDYSQEIRVGQIQLNPSLRTSSNSD